MCQETILGVIPINMRVGSHRRVPEEGEISFKDTFCRFCSLASPTGESDVCEINSEDGRVVGVRARTTEEGRFFCTAKPSPVMEVMQEATGR